MPTHRLLLAATVATLAVLASAVGPAPAGAAPPTASAQAGADWLAGQQQADGSFTLLTNTVSDTGNALLALASVSGHDTDVEEAMAYLAAHADGITADDPGTFGTVIMAVVAEGGDPTSVGGRNLVAGLQATRRTSGPDAGLYGSQDPTFDGAVRQSLGILGLAAAGVGDPDALAWLARQQCPDAGWQAYRPTVDGALAACTPSTPGNFSSEDSNATAYATEAMRAVSATFCAGNPLSWLDGAQNPDGGFGFLKGDASDTNSTALAIQAIVASGEDPSGGQWVVSSNTPYTSLTSMQVTSGGDQGAFTFFGSANGYATAQAVPAAAGTAFPLDRTGIATTPGPCFVPGTGTPGSGTSGATSSQVGDPSSTSGSAGASTLTFTG